MENPELLGAMGGFAACETEWYVALKRGKSKPRWLDRARLRYTSHRHGRFPPRLLKFPRLFWVGGVALANALSIDDEIGRISKGSMLTIIGFAHLQALNRDDTIVGNGLARR